MGGSSCSSRGLGMVDHGDKEGESGVWSWRGKGLKTEVEADAIDGGKPRIAQLFRKHDVVDKPPKNLRKRKAGARKPAAVGLEEASGTQVSTTASVEGSDCTSDNNQEENGEIVEKKIEASLAHESFVEDGPKTETTVQKVKQLHSPLDLMIVKKMKEAGDELSAEFVSILRGKVFLLKEWGVPWKAEEMNCIFNHHGKQWVAEHPNMKLESTLVELERAYGFSMDDLGKILSGNPALLTMDVDTTLFIVEEFYMRNLGFKRPDMRKLLIKNPEMFTLDFTYMASIAGFMRAELGIHKQFLRQTVERHPHILMKRFDTQSFEQNLSLVTKAVLKKTVSVTGRKVVPALTHQEKIVLSKVLSTEPNLMTMEDLPEAIEIFQETGLYQHEISLLFLHHPYLFPNAMDIHVDYKIAFLMEKCGRSFDDVCLIGGLLFRHEKEIYSRMGFLHCLGLDQRQWKLKEILDGGSERFCKRVTLTPVDSYHKFVRAWTPPEDWTRCCKIDSRL